MRYPVPFVLAISLFLALSLPASGAAPPESAPGATEAADDLEGARRLIEEGRYTDAEALARDLLAEAEAEHGKDSAQVAEVLDVLVKTLTWGGKLTDPETEDLGRRAVRIKERHFGAGAREVADSLNVLASLLSDRGDYDEAAALFERAIAIYEEALDPGDDRLGNVLNNLATVHTRAGDQDTARRHYERALAIFEKTLGPEAPRTANALGNLALVHIQTGDPEGARPLLERALAIREKALGEMHPDVAMSLLNLAIVLDAPEAIPLLERALVIYEKTVGSEHLQVAYCLNILASNLHDVGDFARARSCRERALAISEKTMGPEHPYVAHCLQSLEQSLSETGDYTGARDLEKRALAILEKALGPEHPRVGGALWNLAYTNCVMGDYAAARTLIERSLEIYERVVGPDHPKVAVQLNVLAWSLSGLGDYASAAEHCDRALAIQEKALGPEHPDLVLSLLNLGVLYSKSGDLAGARSALERAVMISDNSPAVRPEFAGSAMVNLGSVLHSIDDLTGARAVLERAIAFGERSLGPKVEEVVAEGLYGLGHLLLGAGKFAEAGPFVERALAIRQALLGPEHSRVAGSLILLADLRLHTRQHPEALDLALRASEIRRRSLALTAGVAEERLLLLQASTLGNRAQDLLLSLASLEDGAIPSGRARVLDEVIRSRAFVLDEMSSRNRSYQASDDAAAARLASEYRSARERLAHLAVRGPSDLEPEDWRELLDDARKARDRAERALAERSAAFRADLERRRIGLDEVRAALPSGSVLVALALYHHEEPVEEEVERLPEFVPSYLAFVLAEGDAEPAVLRLGAAWEIDALVSAWKEEASRGALNPLVTPAEAEAAYRRAGGALRRAVWDPLRPYLEDARTVFVVPDGALHLVSLATLPDEEGGYLAEGDRRIHYLSAERDLAGPGGAEAPGRGLLALGGPDFDGRSLFAALAPEPEGPKEAAHVAALAAASLFRGERSSCGDFQSLEFAPLPDSAREIREIAASWKKGQRARGGRIRHTESDDLLLLEERASEAAFKALAPGREVVHLATHGFFLGEGCPSALDGAREGAREVMLESPLPALSGENPLLLTGLALAGANHRAAAGPEEEDGILTAEEIAALDLSGVSWAVLSACNTGVGEIQAGEGVFGLQRAFAMAGADTVIMSLWRVDDRTARDWMRALYRARFADGRATVDAVREADLELLQHRRKRGRSTHPYYWSGFVASGDWR